MGDERHADLGEQLVGSQGGLEVNVNVLDPELATQLRGVFERDQERCTELTRDVWRARPVWRRALEWFFFLFYRWM